MTFDEGALFEILLALLRVALAVAADRLQIAVEGVGRALRLDARERVRVHFDAVRPVEDVHSVVRGAPERILPLLLAVPLFLRARDGVLVDDQAAAPLAGDGSARGGVGGGQLERILPDVARLVHQLGLGGTWRERQLVLALKFLRN